MPFSRWTWVFSLGAVLVLACSASKKDAAPATPVAVTEIARADIGPAGGKLVGGAVTIDVPAGAVTTTRSFVISKVDSGASALPQATQLAGDLYALGPDDVDFLVPVTVTISIDEAKKRSDGKGAVVLLRAASGTNQWTPYGANDTSATTLVGKTKHFSYWAPTAAAETRCFLDACSPIPPPRMPNGLPQGPEVLPGLDCKVPADGPGVRCIGRGANSSFPYDCFCDGSDTILGTWQRLPPDTAITAMAAQCGGTCPATSASVCDLGVACDPTVASPSWKCSTAKGPVLSCSYDPTMGALCTCPGGTPFTLQGVTAPPTSAQLFTAWQSSCGGDCNGGNPSNDFVCPGSIEFPDDAGTGCVTETAGTCRDNHVYRVECDVQMGATPTTCHCKVDGMPTKDVTSTCLLGPQACGWPKQQGM